MTFTKQNLSKKAQENFSVQSYAKASVIDGVVIKEIQWFVDDGGFFMELGRFDQGIHQMFPDFEIKQVNYSQMEPGAVKAFHLHLNQEDVWFVPPHERLLVILSDQREDSHTKDVSMRFVIGEGKARLLYIPRGVAHGVANLSKKSGSIIYFINQQFDAENPDEGRLPWDMLGKDIWEMTRG
jgi:dTDP-4-dehydrorhamnose 3,5-epimerase